MSSNQIHVPGASGAFDPDDVSVVIAVSAPAGSVLIVILKNRKPIFIWDTPEARAMLRKAGLVILTVLGGLGYPEVVEIPDNADDYDPSKTWDKGRKR